MNCMSYKLSPPVPPAIISFISAKRFLRDAGHSVSKATLVFMAGGKNELFLIGRKGKHPDPAGKQVIPVNRKMTEFMIN